MPKYQPQLKHKAQHGNYRKKPSKSAIAALMMMYKGIDAVERILPVKKTKGVQLKLDL